MRVPQEQLIMGTGNNIFLDSISCYPAIFIYCIPYAEISFMEQDESEEDFHIFRLFLW